MPTYQTCDICGKMATRLICDICGEEIGGNRFGFSVEHYSGDVPIHYCDESIDRLYLCSDCHKKTCGVSCSDTESNQLILRSNI